MGRLNSRKPRGRDCQKAAFRWAILGGLVEVNEDGLLLKRKTRLRITNVDDRLDCVGYLHQTAGGAHREANLLL